MGGGRLMQCAGRWFFHSIAEMEKEEIGGAKVFSPAEWMFCEDRPDYKDWSEDRARL